MSLMYELLLWGILWISIWLIFWEVLSKRLNINYLQGWYITALYFLGACLLIYKVFPQRVGNLLHGIGGFEVGIIGILILFNIWIYKMCNLYFIRPSSFMHKQKYQQWLSMDIRFIMSKTFEIAFQQLLIGILAYLLRDVGLSFIGIVFVFAIVFGLAHLPLLKIISIKWGIFFTFFSVLSAGVFPFLILTVPQGIIWSFVVHFLFYTISSVVVWNTVAKKRIYKKLA